MAEVIGESGAWREVRKEVAAYGSRAATPEHIGALLPWLKANLRPSIENKTAETDTIIRDLDQRASALRAETGFLKTIFNWFKLAKCKADILRAERALTSYVAGLENGISRLENLIKSPEFTGARAELSVIAKLKRLPADYVVLNDVHLRATRFHKYNGVPLQSAQIDHLVISPAGLFVIETKAWSKQFVQSRNYHNPFDQVGRASYLCYSIVKKMGRVPVRSIIAASGYIPERPVAAKVKILRVDDLNGYISYFRERVLSPELTGRLRDYFGRMTWGSKLF